MRALAAGISLCLAGTALCGCASIDFSAKDGLIYYEPVPYFFVSTTIECVSTATVVMLPGEKRAMSFNNGYGSSALAATLQNGMISSIGQTTDAKVPETLTAVAAMATAASAFTNENKAQQVNKCKPEARLYPVTKGEPVLGKQIDFPVKVAP